MNRNVGTLDRIARGLLALVILRIAWKNPGKAGILSAFTAGQLFSSALSGYCPLYKLGNINTVGKPF